MQKIKTRQTDHHKRHLIQNSNINQTSYNNTPQNNFKVKSLNSNFSFQNDNKPIIKHPNLIRPLAFKSIDLLKKYIKDKALHSKFIIGCLHFNQIYLINLCL